MLSGTKESSTAEEPKASIKLILSSTVFGTVIEWYDFYIYGTAAALVFGKLFFPGTSAFMSTLLAMLTFAAGLLARPVGAVLFGHLGDRIGRRDIMVATMALMGVPTLLIGLLPTYATAGIWAPVGLVVLRILQGLALGGEWGGAVLMAVEHSSDRRKSIFGSLPQMGIPAGVVTAAGVFYLVTVISGDQLETWGWRVPFIVSAFLVIIALYIRLRVPETPDFKRARTERRIERMPFISVLKREPRSLFLTACAKAGEVTLFFLTTVFLISYATQNLDLNRNYVLALVVLGSLISLVNIPLGGWLGGRFGPRRIYLMSNVALAVVAFPMFYLLETRTTVGTLLAFIVPIGLVFPIILGSQANLLAQQFPTELRYTGMSVGVSITSGVAGGFAPTIATALVHWSGNAIGLGYYLTVMALLSAWSAYMMKSVKDGRAVEKDARTVKIDGGVVS